MASVCGLMVCSCIWTLGGAPCICCQALHAVTLGVNGVILHVQINLHCQVCCLRWETLRGWQARADMCADLCKSECWKSHVQLGRLLQVCGVLLACIGDGEIEACGSLRG